MKCEVKKLRMGDNVRHPNFARPFSRVQLNYSTGRQWPVIIGVRQIAHLKSLSEGQVCSKWRY